MGEGQTRSRLGAALSATTYRTQRRRTRPWIKQVEATEGAPLKGFLHGLRRDEAAVRNAFTSPWSNGQTEGQVNRLKCLNARCSAGRTLICCAPAS
ncbi:MAG TPA: transposase [Blastocatellia bacterium]|nr:transposase [Blastocatellia bacterium]HMV87522.1 transposase [Blastocatellia bacterium]HMX29628.1 transposase [Blastocatellia bacterium]HMZ19125.1 transposase [Blastocatellia bacterium]HNG34382.1 transposase [Blastocatellia bacterium]